MIALLALLLAPRALAHGGEDHAEPAAATVTSSATNVSIAASSALFEAVLRVGKANAGTTVPTTLLLADFATSAPVQEAEPRLTLQGPASVELSLARTSPGAWTGTAVFPADGDYAGALVISTPQAADVLPLSGLHLAPDPVPVPGATPVAGLALAGAAAGVAGLFAVGLGFALGRRRGGAAALLLVGVGAARGVSAHGGEDHGEASAPGPTSGALTLPLESQFLVGLRTTRLVHDLLQPSVSALGQFISRPGGSASLRSPAAGELVAPRGGFPGPGAVVARGQVLGVIRAAVGSADRAALATARQDAANAVAEARRAVALAEADSARSPGLDMALSARERLDRDETLRVARTSLAEAEAALAGIGDGGQVEVRAPFAGRLGSMLARPGDQVEAGEPLFRLLDGGGLWMQARVPERYAGALTSGSPARVIAASAPETPLDGVILDAGQEVDPSTGSLTVTVVLDAPGSALRPGMSATAWLAEGPRRDTLVVPSQAVVDSNGVPIAFVKAGPERFELRELSLGARSGDAFEVTSGLAVGERVVVDGTYSLRSLAGR